MKKFIIKKKKSTTLFYDGKKINRFDLNSVNQMLNEFSHSFLLLSPLFNPKKKG